MSLGRRSGFKTKLCPQYSHSRVCDNGDLCKFAHGKRELRTLENALYKSQLCTAFTQSGTCQLDEDCLFAHDISELRKDDDEFDDVIVVSPGGGVSGGRGHQQQTGGTGSDRSSPVGSMSNVGSAIPTRILSRNNPNSNSSSAAESRLMNGNNTSVGGTLGSMQQSQGSHHNLNASAPACHAFQRSGVCPRGITCPYSHIPRSVAAAAAAASNGVGSGGGGGVGVDLSDTSSSVGGSLNDSLAASKYKTALCHAFQKNNRCANGDNCRYAHGTLELQPVPEKAPPAPMDPNDPKYKTKLCIKYEKEKKCLAGDNCNFAHGIEELRNRSPEEEQKVSDRYKTSVCQIFLEKVICPRGPNCTYAHGRYELRPIGFKGDFEAKIMENPRWKCNLCKAWCETNRCKNGDDCSYAHGEKELRSEKPGAPDVRRFKTELCKKLFSQGFCPQGSICTFAHSESDLQQNRNLAMVSSSSASGSSKSSPTSLMLNNSNMALAASAMFANEQNSAGTYQALKIGGSGGGGGGGAGFNDRISQFGMSSSSFQAPGGLTTNSSKNNSMMMNRNGPNKDVEMFSDFLEFMKLKESGVLDALKHAVNPVVGGMMQRPSPGAPNPPIPAAMPSPYSMGGSGSFLGSQFSSAGGLAGPSPMDALGGPTGVIPLNAANGHQLGGMDSRLTGSHSSAPGANPLIDFSPIGNSQMRKRKYEPF